MPISPDSSTPSHSAFRERIEALLGTHVEELALYELALTHRSYLRHRSQNTSEAGLSNERLEFLGDALLGFTTAEHLYAYLPDQSEGYLTRLRAKLVNGRALARYARRLELGQHILMSENMARSGGRQNATLLADAYEALIGALYLDRGLEAARSFIHLTVFDAVDLNRLARREENFKSRLLEYLQGQGRSQPQYRIIEEEGPSHDKTFTAGVFIEGEPYGRGTAGSKQKAEQQAAAEALDQLHEEDADSDAST